MFECVGRKDTTVTQFGFRFNGGYGLSPGYEVFKLNMPGSFAGHMFTPGAWSKVASGFALSNYLAGAITAEFEVHVLAGQTQAFYIRGTGRGLVSYKTNGYGGVYKSDENMKLMVGVGLPSSFSDGYGDDYYVNPNFITVHYITDRTPSSLSPPPPPPSPPPHTFALVAVRAWPAPPRPAIPRIPSSHTLRPHPFLSPPHTAGRLSTCRSELVSAPRPLCIRTRKIAASTAWIEAKPTPHPYYVPRPYYSKREMASITSTTHEFDRG